MPENKKYSWSLDISTTNVGTALWNEENELVELKHLELKVDKSVPPEDRMLVKADIFAEYISDYKKRVLKTYGADIENVFVEAPFSNTPKNINTTALLLGFNGISRYILYKEFNIHPFMVTVYQARKLFCSELVTKTKKRDGTIKETLSFPKDVDKKHYIWGKVAKMEPDVEWFYTRNETLKSSSYDMSDSYVVGYSGLKILNEL
ncbi:MAG: hypothetical protein ACXAAH_16775 [Promethearchaeota archaeon]|jgi:hypothetical protein